MSQMYPWIGTTWNPLAGKCPHKCTYCYRTAMMRIPAIRDKYTGPIRLDPTAMKKNLGEDKTIFVCSMGDLFAQGVPSTAIKEILNKCNDHHLNTYLFQTKNPQRIMDFVDYMPPNIILGTTIESNYVFLQDDGNVTSGGATPRERKEAMKVIRGSHWFADRHRRGTARMLISVEPVLKFDPEQFPGWLKEIRPDFVSIGADSKGHGLYEPAAGDIWNLIAELNEAGIAVKVKDNLERLIG